MAKLLRIGLGAFAFAIAGAILWAQEVPLAFGGLKNDTTLPVEVVADQLEVDQSTGVVTFTGNVQIGQGEMRLTAQKVVVEYATDDQSTGRISRMFATGNVVLVSGAEAAEADEAVYTIDTGSVTMKGNVILTQGQNALSAQVMVVDLTTGTARMEGRVKTILQPSNN